MHRTCLPLAAIVALASGCAFEGDVDLTGSYLVRATYWSSPCGHDKPTTSSTMSLTFTPRLGSGYTYVRCNDAAGTDCPEDFFNGFDERIDDGWRGTYAQAGELDDTHCSIDYIVQTATIEDGHLVLDTRYSTGEIELPSSQCDEAAGNYPSLQCTMHERIEATKL